MENEILLDGKGLAVGYHTERNDSEYRSIFKERTGRKDLKKQNNTGKRVRRNDIILIAMLALAGVIAAFLFLTMRGQGAQVVVRVGGEVTHVFPLNKDMDIIIEGAGGGTNHLIIEDGAAWLEEASCPNKLCVYQGKIQYSGDSIICLPNQVVVEISGGDELGLDAVAK